MCTTLQTRKQNIQSCFIDLLKTALNIRAYVWRKRDI